MDTCFATWQAWLRKQVCLSALVRVCRPEPPEDFMRCVSIDSFLAQPAGSYVLGAQHVIWCLGPHAAGTVAWGRITTAEAEQIVHAWRFEAAMRAPYDALVDLSGLTGVDGPAFEVVARDLAARLPDLATRIRRQALVRPPGLPGALVAGFYPVLGPGFEWKDFVDRASAFAWVWPRDPTVGTRIAALADAARAGSTLVVRVREAVRIDLPHAPDIHRVAERMALSTRSLQRALAEHHTTFRAEVQAVRIEVAKELLRGSDLKLDIIATRVGCQSVPAFVTLFRRVVGITPGAFRKSLEDG